jgi:hypothetical protein
MFTSPMLIKLQKGRLSAVAIDTKQKVWGDFW